MFGKGMIKKVLMFLVMGPIGLLFGGGFSITDLLFIPMIAPMFSGIFGSLTGGAGLGSLFGAAPAAGATT